MFYDNELYQRVWIDKKTSKCSIKKLVKGKCDQSEMYSEMYYQKLNFSIKTSGFFFKVKAVRIIW